MDADDLDIGEDLNPNSTKKKGKGKSKAGSIASACTSTATSPSAAPTPGMTPRGSPVPSSDSQSNLEAPTGLGNFGTNVKIEPGVANGTDMAPSWPTPNFNIPGAGQCGPGNLPYGAMSGGAGSMPGACGPGGMQYNGPGMSRPSDLTPNGQGPMSTWVGTNSGGPGMMSGGPGMMSSGPGMMSSGPGMMSGGPGMMSSGPGMMSGGPGMMSGGQGMMSGGPGMMSSGPGMMSSGLGMMSSGPNMSGGQGMMSGGQGMMSGGQGMMSGAPSGQGMTPSGQAMPSWPGPMPSQHGPMSDRPSIKHEDQGMSSWPGTMGGQKGSMCSGPNFSHFSGAQGTPSAPGPLSSVPADSQGGLGTPGLGSTGLRTTGLGTPPVPQGTPPAGLGTLGGAAYGGTTFSGSGTAPSVGSAASSGPPNLEPGKLAMSGKEIKQETATQGAKQSGLEKATNGSMIPAGSGTTASGTPTDKSGTADTSLLNGTPTSNTTKAADEVPTINRKEQNEISYEWVGSVPYCCSLCCSPVPLVLLCLKHVKHPPNLASQHLSDLTIKI